MRKNIVMSMAALMLSCTAFSVMAQQEVRPKTDRVTVYTDGAIVEKSVRLSLKKGENRFILTGEGNWSMIHFSSGDDWFVSNYTSSSETVPEDVAAKNQFSAAVYQQYVTLKDKKDALSLQKNNLTTHISVLHTQLSALNNIKAVKNTSAIDTVATLKDQFEYQRSEKSRIQTLLASDNKELESVNYDLGRVSNRLDSLVRANNSLCPLQTYSKNTRLDIYANRAKDITLYYSYKVAAQTDYFYDVMLDEKSGKAVFSLLASLRHSSGESWKDCRIVLSTASSENSGQDSGLDTWYLDYNDPVVYSRKVYASNRMLAAKAVQLNAVAEADAAAPQEEETEDAFMETSSVEDLALSREYSLNTVTSVPTGEKVTVPVRSDTADVVFTHLSTPKNAEKVYYTALLPDWEDLSLMDVKSRVYLDGKYVCDSYINTSTTADTMKFSAGEDKDVRISRKVKRSSLSKNLLSSQVEQTVTVEIKINNTKNTPVTLSLKDQVPVSANSDIKVSEIKHDTDAQYESSTGLMKWNLSLSPKEQKTITFSYNVKYTKGKKITLN